ncbi:exodeoxyribonuclease VII small subunit [Virgibacillus salexigens]|uniref:exodeoxyribonuclease VII small subunit n=1 Tax=Virgibacillus salexigens TaxID=61016 RepID=UPI00190A0A32|nr:exodeoxyribonuclease VII small subunit [Virgibacillus salexigens]
MAENDELSFEEAMEKLEEIVGKLETGDAPIEKAIDYYQEGMKLSKLCNDKLTNVEEKMTKIMNEQGDLAPFQMQEEE